MWEWCSWCILADLRMGSDSLLMPVWRSVGDGFTGKGESDV